MCFVLEPRLVQIPADAHANTGDRKRVEAKYSEGSIGHRNAPVIGAVVVLASTAWLSCPAAVIDSVDGAN